MPIWDRQIKLHIFLTEQQTLPSEESEISPSLACERSETVTLHLGPFRDFDLSVRGGQDFKRCFYYFPILIATVIFVFLGVVLHLTSLVLVVRLSLWKQRKYLQLLLLNFSTLVSALSFGFFISYRHFVILERFMCLLGYQVFTLGLSWNTFSLISLSIDCAVAVYYPLKFRSLMTTRQFFLLNGGAFVFLVTFLFAPISIFGSINDGYLDLWCKYYIIPRLYAIVVLALSGLAGFILVLLNFGIGLGVVVAFLQRQKLAKDAEIKSKLLKLVFRLLTIICVNILTNLPLSLKTVGIDTLNDALSIAIAMTNGVINIFIFGFSDEQFRMHILACFNKL